MNKYELERTRDILTKVIDWMIDYRNTGATTSTQWHEADEIADELIAVRKIIYDILERV